MNANTEPETRDAKPENPEPRRQTPKPIKCLGTGAGDALQNRRPKHIDL
jgi:hypothetical protein